MKKFLMSLIISLSILMSFNTKAGLALPEFLIGMSVVEFANSKYNFPLPACANEASKEGTYSNGSAGYSFNVTACDYKNNPGKYTLKQ